MGRSKDGLRVWFSCGLQLGIASWQVAVLIDEGSAAGLCIPPLTLLLQSTVACLVPEGHLLVHTLSCAPIPPLT